MRCSVKSGNERNPCDQLPPPKQFGEHSGQTALHNGEEGGDDVKSVWSLRPGLHTCYNAQYRGEPTREGEPIPENWAQFRLKAATRLHEAGIASNGASATAP